MMRPDPSVLVEPAGGLPTCADSATSAAPRYLESDVIAPHRTVGLDRISTLKGSYWRVEPTDTVQASDPDFISLAINLKGGRVWRDADANPCEPGTIALQPFEGARWRFDRRVSFAQLYIPFSLASSVCASLYERDLEHDQLRMPSMTMDPLLVRTAHSVQALMAAVPVSTLLLDSWALMLSERLISTLSSHSERGLRLSRGRISDRALARVADFVESHVGNDLSLGALADVAALSPYHFARKFKAALGVSPHAYVIGRRVRRAEAMLGQRNADLSIIAAACGFSSQSHFTTTFLRINGVTPGAYRRAALL